MLWNYKPYTQKNLSPIQLKATIACNNQPTKCDRFLLSVSEFLASLEEHLHNACDVLIKKVDKKKDKQLVFAHRQSLLEQIEGCEDPSQLLLLACLVIFQFQVTL